MFPPLGMTVSFRLGIVRGQPGTQAIRGWPDIPGWPGYGRPTVDPWMAWVCSGPTGDLGHLRMARAIQG